MNCEEYTNISQADYNERIAWFKDARFGLFIHYGLFSAHGMGEWAQFSENRTIAEWEAMAKNFAPKPGCCDEWCDLAVKAGAKYAVLTTRHHEGFSLWDSKVNPFNSMNLCGRDIVREFTDSCRRHGLKIGLYSSLMDWRHPDGWRCMHDTEARKRFLDYIEALNTELLTRYGRIDILWYDMPWPQMNAEEWDSPNRNYRLRQLQPHILINNRSRMPEDFFTPEETLNLPAGDMNRVKRDGAAWEACLTFNGFSWGYVNAEQAKAYSFTGQRIARTLAKCASDGGNLLLNIGPKGDGSVPDEAVMPLESVGKWLNANAEAFYGVKARSIENNVRLNQVTQAILSPDEKTVYAVNFIWPKGSEMSFGGIKSHVKRITYLASGEEIPFEIKDYRLILKNLPAECPDKILGIPVLKLEFDEKVRSAFGCYYPQMTNGEDFSDGKGNP